MAPSSEQTFFADPALDRAVGMIMTLAAELYVVRDRQRALEVLLEGQGVLEPGALDAYTPSAEEAERLKSERDAFVAGLLQHTTGLRPDGLR